MASALTIPADVHELARLTEAVHHVLVDAAPDLKAQVALAVQELCANIVRHAYAGASGTITCQFQRDEGTLTMTFRDYGPNAYDETVPVEAPDPLDLPEGGWGLFLIYQVIDHIAYERLSDGNRWTLIKKLEHKDGA